MLVSFFYFRNADLDDWFVNYLGEPLADVMADSGGFSAWSLGKEVRLSDYIAWLQRWKHRIHYYANLDVIKSHEDTLENQRIMEDAGLTPLPIVHYGEPWHVLDYYADRYPYVMVGGVAGVQERPWRKAMAWLIQAFKRIGHKTALHGLGLSDYRVLASLPWYSADASSFTAPMRFRTLTLFDLKARRPVTIDLRSNAEVWAARGLIRSYGVPPAMLANLRRQEAEHAAKRAREGISRLELNHWLVTMQAAGYLRMEYFLRRRHGEIPMRDHRGDHVGHNYYTAGTNSQQLISSRAVVMMAKGETPPELVLELQNGDIQR